MRWLVAVLALAGCDKLLSFQHVDPAFQVTPAAETIAAGTGLTCRIDSHGALWCWGENDIGMVGNGARAQEVDTPAPIDDRTWLAVSAHHKHACGLLADHSLWCWGIGDDGRLGLGSLARSNTPAQVMAGTSFVTVAAGTSHTCAIDDQTNLWCWGAGYDGQIGDGMLTAHQVAFEVGSGFASVAAGQFHTCALALDGSLSCWGSNGHGQLGDGTAMAHHTPEAIGTETWRAIAAGLDHTCGITTTGHLRCWGHNHVGQLGIPLGDVTTPTTVVTETDRTDWLGVVANDYHTCAWTSDGSAFCFGDSSHGEFGTFDTVNATPVAIGTVAAVALGENHVCAIDKQGAMSCAGADGWAQLGQGGHDERLAPRQVGTATAVAAGATATCVLDNAQHASCAGNNFYGQLGDGTQTSHAMLQPISSGQAWSQLALGTGHACAVQAVSASTAPTTLWCWGDNEDGQLATAAGAPSTTPTATTVMGTAMSASAAGHSCAVHDNSLYCWGPNLYGQLGDNTIVEHASPIMLGYPMPMYGAWAKVGLGSGFTCAIDTSNATYCWGRHDHGILGDGDASKVIEKPTDPPIHQFTAVAAGGQHACGLEPGGNAYCWGYNGEGQLGFSSPPASADVPTPTMIPGHQWLVLELGDLHTCGIDTMNHLFCWGDNRRGQIGNGDTQRTAVMQPTQIGTSTWSALAVGAYHTCAIDSAGQLWCWGSDDDGALGDGGGASTTMLPVPIPP